MYILGVQAQITLNLYDQITFTIKEPYSTGYCLPLYSPCLYLLVYTSGNINSSVYSI